MGQHRKARGCRRLNPTARDICSGNLDLLCLIACLQFCTGNHPDRNLHGCAALGCLCQRHDGEDRRQTGGEHQRVSDEFFLQSQTHLHLSLAEMTSKYQFFAETSTAGILTEQCAFKLDLRNLATCNQDVAEEKSVWRGCHSSMVALKRQKHISTTRGQPISLVTTFLCFNHNLNQRHSASGLTRLDQLGSLLRNHDSGRIGVAGDQLRHDGRVHHP